MPCCKRTLATLRMAELGFLGVVVYTRVHTPRFWGQAFKAGALLLSSMVDLPFLTNCCIVGIYAFLYNFSSKLACKGRCFFLKNNKYPKNISCILPFRTSPNRRNGKGFMYDGCGIERFVLFLFPDCPINLFTQIKYEP
jgi:hypothetical protein